MIGLTPRQRDALRFITACGAEAPSHRELALALNLKAPSAAYRLVQQLEERGYVHRGPRNCWRTISPPILIDGHPYRFIPKTRAG